MVTRVNGELIEIEGLLQNIAAIKTKAIDVNLAYRTPETTVGRVSFTWNNTFLRNFDVIVPGPTGPQLLSREGTQVGAPAQAFPKHKSVFIMDWERGAAGATFTTRYVSPLREVGGQIMDSVAYIDLQARYAPSWWGDRIAFAVGANNVFNVRTPGCVSCESNNFSQMAHDIPGRYYYARLSLKM